MIVPNLITRTTCRLCGSDYLEPIFSLGNHYLYNLIDKDDDSPQYRAPLDLVFCSNCFTPQLRHTVPRDMLFRKYFYESGINTTMRKALADITSKIETMINLQKGDIVVDIGSNDSYMLTTYKTDGLVRVGFEPAENLMEKARQYGYTIINDYFSAKAFKNEFPDKKAKAVSSIAMFYDLEDPLKFTEDVATILDNEGIWVIQMNYLPLMMWQNAFDNIGHEHLLYLSFTNMEDLLDRCGLKPIQVEFNDVNGGSFRIYVTKKESSYCLEDGSVEATRQMEDAMQLSNKDVYVQFGKRLESIRRDLTRIVLDAKRTGKRIYIYGASTRGSTTLQYCGIDGCLIKYAAERNPSKWGKKTAGTNIQIISEEQMRNDYPDYLLILPFAFLKEFQTREKDYLDKGGHFIVPLPYVKII